MTQQSLIIRFFCVIALLVASVVAGCSKPQTREEVMSSEPVAASPVVMVEGAVPQWMGEDWAVLALKLSQQMQQDFGALTKDAQIRLSWQQGEEGQLSLAGDTRQGEIRILLTGQGWQDASDKARELYRQNLAHEMVHLWQRDWHDDVGELLWLHEGLAQVAARDLLVEAGIWTPEMAQASRQADRASCALVLKTGPLAPQLQAGDRAAIYSCGSVMAKALLTWQNEPLSTALPRISQAQSQAQLVALISAMPSGAQHLSALGHFQGMDFTLARGEDIFSRLANGEL